MTHRGIDIDITFKDGLFTWTFIFNQEKFTKSIDMKDVNGFQEKVINDAKKAVDQAYENN